MVSNQARDMRMSHVWSFELPIICAVALPVSIHRHEVWVALAEVMVWRPRAPVVISLERGRLRTSYLPGWGPEGGRQAMGGRAIGWDGGKNLQARRMLPVGESEGKARCGWVGKGKWLLPEAMPRRKGDGGGSQR
jgi:hypothetical protein